MFVRIGDVARELGLSVSRVRQLADAGRIPSTRTAGGHRVFDVAQVREAVTRAALPFTPAPPPALVQDRVLAGLEEHIVWLEAADRLALRDRVSDGCIRGAEYGFTEILNNAVDHSRGTSAVCRWWVDATVLVFEVCDDGEGAFVHLRDGLALGDSFAAIQELSKGKTTTDPSRHTGEGIFFTSKISDVFVLAANGLRWTVDNLRDDQAVGVSDRTVGTVVRCEFDAQTGRTPADVFDRYSVDHDFVRTRTAVRLFEIGVRFVSRSEARRLMHGLERFEEILVDFRGVEEVGQGFVDEVFRVWPGQHPGHRVVPVNMAGPVEAMVRRGLPRAGAGGGRDQ